MVDIIPAARRNPSFAERINQGVEQGINSLRDYQEQQQREQHQEQYNGQLGNLSKQIGIDLAGIPPESRNKFLDNFIQQQQQEQKFAHETELANYKYKEQAEQLEGKNREKLSSFQGAFAVLNRMKELRKGGKLGLGSSYSPYSDTRKAAGEYSQLGKSLIQYSSNIPIRNKAEFETLAEKLYDPNLTDATAEGILNAMERILMNAMSQHGGQQQQMQAPGISKPQIQPGLGETKKQSLEDIWGGSSPNKKPGKTIYIK